MPTTNLESILDQAKSLSEPDRARLAHDLLATLDGKHDADAAAAWEQEVRDGTAKTISAEELTERLTNRRR